MLEYTRILFKMKKGYAKFDFMKVQQIFSRISFQDILFMQSF